MFRSTLVVATALLLLNSNYVRAQVSIDLCCQTGTNVDLGNIASEGLSGRRTVIRPLSDGEEGDRYEFFGSSFLTEEGRYPQPPDSPAQRDIILTEGTRLALTLPQLSHFPQGADIDVQQITSLGLIEATASIHFWGWSTDWLAPPHEYIHDLGVFTAGDYRLNLDVETSYWTNPTEPSITTGFIEFTVLPVPEPSTMLGSLVLACAAMCTRRL